MEWVIVCLFPNSSETANPSDLKFWGMIPLGMQNVSNLGYPDSFYGGVYLKVTENQRNTQGSWEDIRVLEDTKNIVVKSYLVQKATLLNRPSVHLNI